MNQTAYRRKLIEVDLPLDEINAESAREKSIRHGHPSTLHLWWARRPLAACRAVIFASMVDDPSYCPEEFPTKWEQDKERKRLHDLIRRLVKWESTDERNPAARELIAQARYEIACSVARSRSEAPPENDPATVLAYLNDNALPIYDPFAGGGSIPLEAQRLGLRAVASDLNPVAALINKALIELPPKFNGKPPINPDANPMGMMTGKFTGRGRNRKAEQVPWRGAAGLANDIRYYGNWMREEAFKRIGHLYPKAKLPDGGEATVIAWLWARTVPCPNPACGVAMPLMTTFQLSKKPTNRHWTKPVCDRETNSVSFHAQNHDEGIDLERTVIRGGKGVICVACNGASTHAYIREQSKAGNMGERMTAIVAEGDRKRLFVSPTDEHIATALSAEPNLRSIPQQKMPTTPCLVSGRGYGIEYWRELFTKRQLAALTTFSDLMPDVRSLMIEHGAEPQYADAVCTYLALAVSKIADYYSKFCTWHLSRELVSHQFARQAIPMAWDFCEGNPFSNSSGKWMGQVDWIAKSVERLPLNVNEGKVHQADASTTIHAVEGPVIVTDPPYYDNISYAELSDFFYVWLRPLLRDIYPDLFAGILVPIQDEMIAAPRFEKVGECFENAGERFERLMGKTLKLIRERCSPEFPSSIFYAYKQQEDRRGGKTSTGWETMLTALVNAGFQIIGTWPMRTELTNRTNSLGANTLASSVILVCRPRAEDAPVVSRSEFSDTLSAELHDDALDRLTHENHINPVDLRQAAIGPGMSVYSRYSGVEKMSGKAVSVRDALMAINKVVSAYMEREEGSLDAESRFCLGWLRAHSDGSGGYGEAENLARAHNLVVEERLEQAHNLLVANAGNVRLLDIDEYTAERRYPGGAMTAWEGCMRMAWHMGSGDERGGVDGCADVLNKANEPDDIERLARILYDFYDQCRRDSSRAVMFNSVVASWDRIVDRAAERRQAPQKLL